MKKIYIIHGWTGAPDGSWFPWLKEELERKGYAVEIPTMPETDEPVISAWVSHLENIVGDIDENIYFVGHSIGCQAILRYFEKLPQGEKAGGAIFVAGWLTLTNLKNDEEKSIAKPWLENPINFERVKEKAKRFVAIFSDNDKFVPIENEKFFREKLGAETIVFHNMGHFSEDDGFRELPQILDTISNIMKE